MKRLSRCLLTVLILCTFKARSQTSGPTAPEYTSFEPVDVTDMVNLATGDFTYTLPLLEVPGPEGGYPLALSYHAGIQPMEEASWVGLGFTLNAGAITRTVSGYPDDQLAVPRVVRDHDNGGTRHTFSVGVGLPGASFGLQFSQDTHQGFGVGASVSVSAPVIGSGTSAVSGGPGLVVGVDPYGNAYQSVGAGFTIGKSGEGAKGLTANVGVSTNFESTSFNTGIGHRENGSLGEGGAYQAGSATSLLGASMSTTGGGSASVGIASLSQTNTNADNWTVNSSGFSLPIPLGSSGVFLNLGYNYMRYYLDQTDYVNIFGSLQASGVPLEERNRSAFDSYALLDTDIDFIENNDPAKEAGGSFPAYDRYQVNAQGITGSMHPFIFQNISLFGQDEPGQVAYRPEAKHQGKVQFRFANDFSNALTLDPLWRYNAATGTFENTANQTETYGFENNRLVGSKHVEWYTNLDIRNGVAHADGLISHDFFGNQALLFDSLDVSGQIGGFKVTKADGMTYHFSLPVYTYEEGFQVQDKEDPGKFHQRYEEQPYAYQWLLVAITGPDFVDRGEPGLDGTDWGYWVGFNYDQYVVNHRWRNPGTGFHTDIDNQSTMFSYGMKELYYLDAIFTRTHAAFFHRSSRRDGREVSSLIEGGFDEKVTEYEGYYTVRKKCRERWIFPFIGLYFTCLENIAIVDTLYYPRPLLKLDKITLHKRADLLVDEPRRENTLRAIAFDYDYSLQPETPNSYDETDVTKKSGKLTLKKVTFLGREEARILPPVSFGYEVEADADAEVLINGIEETLEVVSGTIQVGDLLHYTIGVSTEHYMVVTGRAGERYTIETIGQNQHPAGTFKIGVQKTKNPPFRSNGYDSWGMYKSDFDEELLNLNEDVARLTTPVSSQSTDAWSLRKIHSANGATIDIGYASDRYDQPVFHKRRVFHAIALTPTASQNLVTATFSGNVASLNDLFTPDQSIDLDVLVKIPRKKRVSFNSSACGTASTTSEDDYFSVTVSGTIRSIDEVTHQMEVFTPEVFEQLNVSKTLVTQTSGGIDRCPSGLSSCREGCCPSCQSGEGCVSPIRCERFTKEYYEGGGTIAALSINSGDSIRSFGGGLQVAQLTVSGTGTQSTTRYRYQSGITSYDPTHVNSGVYLAGQIPEKGRIEYERLLNGKFSSVLALSQEIPPPGIVYGQVTVTEQVGERPVPGKVVYEFQTFDSTMVRRMAPRTFGDFRYPMTIQNFTNQVGNLNAVYVYGADKELLNRQEYHYLNGLFPKKADYLNVLKGSYSNQGVMHEAFHERKDVNEEGVWVSKVSLSRKERYPNIMVGKETYDGKSGAHTESWNLSFNRLSGQLTRSLTIDSYGSHTLTETRPAYEIPAYTPQMQPMAYGGKNMLEQQVSTTTYLVAPGTDDLPILTKDWQKQGVLGASVQTWSDTLEVVDDEENRIFQTGIPRQWASYQWVGQGFVNEDGSYQVRDFEAYPFDFRHPSSSDARWERQSEVTLVDVYSHALEARDLNGQHAATRMVRKDGLIVATAAPAQYGEFTFSGAEYYEGNDLADQGTVRQDGGVSTSRAHTGVYSLLVASGREGFSYTLNESEADLTQPYRASVWVYFPGDAETPGEIERFALYAEADGVEIASVSAEAQKKKSKSWYLIELDLIPPTGATSIRIATYNDAVRPVYMDDFRVHPLEAVMVSYVYDPFTNEVTHILDKDNLYTRYEYNAAGVLVRVSQEHFYTVDHTLSESLINYGENTKK
ncbi:MAG: hypothetical protein AAGA66_04255 [Bacteroidota bacterium]